MGIIDTLKWLWDPRTDEQKRYETDPLRRYTQEVQVYIKGIETPFDRIIEFEDTEYGDWLMRVDIDCDVQEWLDNRAKKGVMIDNVWYSPAQIDRIKIGNVTVEDLK